MTIKEISRNYSITRTEEFEKKQLATHALNVGLMCGNHCKYCYAPSLYRHRTEYFEEYENSAFKGFENGLSIIDPTTPDRIAKEAKKLTPNDTVLFCSTTDGWSPEALRHDLGFGCLYELFENSNCKVRILTKNVAVVKDFELLEYYKERVFFSMSLTAPLSKSHLIKILEPNASSIEERLCALKEAKRIGIPIFGMLCPCIPGIASDEADFRELLKVILEFDPAKIWAEPINRRGRSLINCESALREAGYPKVADRIRLIRNKKNFQQYVHNFIRTVNQVSTELGCKERMRILVYEDGENFQGDGSSVIWLKEKKSKNEDKL